jgi:hypothetical protein
VSSRLSYGDRPAGGDPLRLPLPGPFYLNSVTAERLPQRRFCRQPATAGPPRGRDLARRPAKWPPTLGFVRASAPSGQPGGKTARPQNLRPWTGRVGSGGLWPFWDLFHGFLLLYQPVVALAVSMAMLLDRHYADMVFCGFKADATR